MDEGSVGHCASTALAASYNLQMGMIQTITGAPPDQNTTIGINQEIRGYFFIFCYTR